MEGKFLYSLAKSYPHMKPADVRLWEKFISAFPDLFSTVDYDVLVGEGVVINDPEIDVYSKSFQMLTQKKIDVIGYKNNDIVIIEIKPRAGANAMGQILSYKELWLKKNPGLLPNEIVMAVITDELQSDFVSIYQNSGITAYEVGF